MLIYLKGGERIVQRPRNSYIPYPLPIFPNTYMLDTSKNRQKNMQFGKGGLNRTPLLTLKIEKNAYLHETVWVETTASSRKMNTENFEKIGNSISSMHYLLVKSSKKGVFIANRKPSYYKRC